MQLSLGLLPRMLFWTLVILGCGAESAELLDINANARATGMGSAFVTKATNSDALFYNPAGLVRNEGMGWRVLGGRLGLNGAEVLSVVNTLATAPDLTTALAGSYGKQVWVGGGAITSFYAPYFGFAIYNHLSSSVGIGNPASPFIDLRSYNDFGYVAGGAFPILPMLHMGFNLRYIRRFGTEQTFSAGSFATLDPAEIQAAARSESRGYGLDMGLNFIGKGPIAPQFSFVWKDIGSTSFTPVSPGGAQPPPQKDEMILGAGAMFDAGVASISPEVNIKHLNRIDTQFSKKIHVGVEVDLPILALRAGYNQGYYALGLGVDLGLFTIDASTYGVELGEYPGQQEDRRYMVEFALEFSVGSEDWGGGVGANGKGSKGGGSRGFFGGRQRLKQRR